MLASKTLRCLPWDDDYYIRHNREQAARELAPRIAALGYDKQTAARYASLISRNPCRNEEDKIVVISVEDGGLVELAHLEFEALFPKGDDDLLIAELALL